MVHASIIAALSLGALTLAAPLHPIEGDALPPYPVIRTIFARQNGTTPPPAPGDSPVNAATLQLIEDLEGFRSDYYDIDGDQTIGYGHDCTQRGDCDSISAPITEEEGQALLIQDLPDYTGCVCDLPNASGLNANQFGALSSFTYNAGCGGVQDAFSSYMDSSDFSGICSALPSTYTNGGELTSRREREADLCNTATSDPSGC